MASDTITVSSRNDSVTSKLRGPGKGLMKSKPCQPCWPSSEESVGNLYTEINGEKFWSLRNKQCTAYLAYVEARAEFDEALNKYTEVTLKHIMWSAYMIGESASLCALCIIFCCVDIPYHEVAEKAFEKCKAIGKYPGMMIRYRSERLRCRGHIVTTADIPALYGDPHRANTSGSDEIKTHHSNASVEANVAICGTSDDDTNRSTEEEAPLYLLPDLGWKQLKIAPRCFSASTVVEPGSVIYTEVEVNQENYLQKATVGGFIRIYGQICLLTSAHSSKNNTQADTDNTTKRIRNFEAAHIIHIGDLVFNSIDNDHADLDYAVFQPRQKVSIAGALPFQHSADSRFRFPKFTSERSFEVGLENTKVYSATASSGIIVGDIEPIPDFLRVHETKESFEVYPVQFDSALNGYGSIAKGDSGSWVICAEDERLHGHVVAGILEDNMAFIVPAHKVFTSLGKAYESVPINALPVKHWVDSPAWRYLGLNLRGNVSHLSPDTLPDPRSASSMLDHDDSLSVIFTEQFDSQDSQDASDYYTPSPISGSTRYAQPNQTLSPSEKLALARTQRTRSSGTGSRGNLGYF